MTVVVRRSALKMWLMAMGGIPLLIISLDVLTQRRITRWLTDIVFRPEDVQIYEPRDVIFAWVMLAFGLLFVGWGLKELFVPTKIVECVDAGLKVRVSGPLRSATLVPWDHIRDVGGDAIRDEGDVIPLFVIGVFDRGDLPDNPWGARWVSEDELGLLAEDWADDPESVAGQVADYAVEAVRRQKREAAAQVTEEEE